MPHRRKNIAHLASRWQAASNALWAIGPNALSSARMDAYDYALTIIASEGKGAMWKRCQLVIARDRAETQRDAIPEGCSDEAMLQRRAMYAASHEAYSEILRDWWRT